MKKLRSGIFYIGVIGIFSALMYVIYRNGTGLEEGRNIIPHTSGKTQWAEFMDGFIHNLKHPLAILLLQIITIILVARLFGWICKKIGQPSVIGEIIAGIILGPSLMGTFFPGFSATFFPVQSLGNLQFLSQIGLILFMFVIGMDLDFKALKNKANEAVVISHASIVVPFALGMGLSYFIYQSFAPAGVNFLSFALFLGIAMSITAFPVLARIVQERGIHKTRLGTIVITCAAADDITAWCILAAVIAIVKAGSFVSSLYVIGMAVVYVLLMLKVVRPFLRRVGDLYNSKENMSKPVVAIFFLTLIISAYATEVIGIHALFGAFMAGAVMPENKKFRNIFIEKIEDVALVLLLPLFFVFTGLRTQIGLLNDPYLWKICALIIVVAIAGKFIGSTIAAKIIGQNWKDSLTIGALMNTRGLMELIVLNIGFDLGILKPEIFTMMVIMALVTTFMTGPALDLINWAFRKKGETVTPSSNIGKYQVLVSFDRPESGVPLIKLANNMVKEMDANASVTAMHLSLSNELHHYNVDEYENDSFGPVILESQNLGQKITTLFKLSGDIDSDIAQVANEGRYDLLLIKLEQSIFEGTLLGKILGFTTRIINPDRFINTVTGKEKLFENSPFDEQTRLILSKSNIPVGILIDRDFKDADKTFVAVFDEKDAYLVEFAFKLIKNAGSKVTILDAVGFMKNNTDIKEALKAMEEISPNQISVIGQRSIDKAFLTDFDLMLISVESWKKLVNAHSLWLNDIPSTLIIKQ